MKKNIQFSSLLSILLTVVTVVGRDYNIVPYDNLWNLSKGFYDDGFEWKRIWKANPYIANPDLIYPGDILVIPGIGEVTVKEDGTYAVYGTSFDEKVATLFQVSEDVDTVPKEAVKVEMIDKKIKDYLITPSALLKVPYIHDEMNSNGFIEPGVAMVDDKSRRSYAQFSTVKYTVDSGKTLKDTSYTLVQHVFYKKLDDKIVNVVKPVAFAQVDSEDSLTITYCWDIVYDSVRVVSTAQGETSGGDIYRVDAAPLEAKLFTRITAEVIFHQYEMFIIDAGNTDGVQVGDLFDVYSVEEREETQKRVGLEVMAVRVQQNSATVIVTKTTEIVKDIPLIFKRKAQLRVQ